MIDISTLFILGAGASKPYGYPTGAELRADIIRNYINHFNRLRDVSQNQIPDIPLKYKQIEAFVTIFANSSIYSIDKFLSLNPLSVEWGKIGILLSILNSEKNSQFRENVSPQEDWYSLLFNRMMEGLKNPEDYKEFSKNKVAFITFNYDRSLEYFLYDSFYHSFYQSRNNIKEDIKKFVNFPIIHVYGTVARFDSSNMPYHDYNQENYNHYLEIENLSDGIMVIDERKNEILKDDLKKLIPNYKRIFFLGFGYAQENLEAINLPCSIDKKTRVYGTAKGMTQKEINRVSQLFPTQPGEVYVLEDGETIDTTFQPIIIDKNCYDLLRQYL
ncbi:MAG: hypothetical protein ABFD50_18150 [Smithella sp.]